ncbi:Double-stranded RNA-binding protein 1 [Linum perenne]
MNRKAAEQSAAEVALIELAKSGDANVSISQPAHGTGLCKNLLQEYAQKKNFAVPSYQCQKYATQHRGHSFQCCVEIGGMKYIGALAKTKKEAEIKAARTAWFAIKEISTDISGTPTGNSSLTVIPCRNKVLESENVPKETVTPPKAKKGRHKKNMMKKKRQREAQSALGEKSANHNPTGANQSGVEIQHMSVVESEVAKSAVSEHINNDCGNADAQPGPECKRLCVGEVEVEGMKGGIGESKVEGVDDGEEGGVGNSKVEGVEEGMKGGIGESVVEGGNDGEEGGVGNSKVEGGEEGMRDGIGIGGSVVEAVDDGEEGGVGESVVEAVEEGMRDGIGGSVVEGVDDGEEGGVGESVVEGGNEGGIRESEVEGMEGGLGGSKAEEGVEGGSIVEIVKCGGVNGSSESVVGGGVETAVGAPGETKVEGLLVSAMDSSLIPENHPEVVLQTESVRSDENPSPENLTEQGSRMDVET